MKRILEICVEDLTSARIAAVTGADRIELCEHLDVGGVTPDAGLIEEAMNTITTPTHVMVRTRDGDFVYSDKDMLFLIDDLLGCHYLSVPGIVIGALTQESSIDIDAMREIMDQAKGLHVTFHKAFDEVPDKFEALDQLVELGVQRVLTSGGKPLACDAVDEINALIEHANGRIEIMAGGGIRPENIEPLLEIPGLTSFHSAGTKHDGAMVDGNVVRKLRELIDR